MIISYALHFTNALNQLTSFVSFDKFSDAVFSWVISLKGFMFVVFIIEMQWTNKRQILKIAGKSSRNSLYTNTDKLTSVIFFCKAHH